MICYPPYAVYEDRRGLNQLNSNSITITSEEKLQEYEELIGILKKSIRPIKRNKIKSAKDLEDFKEARRSMRNASRENQSSDIALMQTNYQFSGSVDRLALWLPARDNLSYGFVKDYTLYYPEEESAFIPTPDLSTGLVGLLDNSGNWVVDPQYNALFLVNSHYLYDRELDTYYWLDREQKALKELKIHAPKENEQNKEEVKDDRLQLVEEMKATSFSLKARGIVCYLGERSMTIM